MFCIHPNSNTVDDFIEDLIDVVSNACHYHVLTKLLTPTHALCLSHFKITKIQSHFNSTCFLRRRLAQALRNILDSRQKRCSQWLVYEWTLLVTCLSHKSVSRRLNPHQKFQRFSLVTKLDNPPIVVNLMSDYKTAHWKLDEALLRRQVNHLRKLKRLSLTFRQARPRVADQIKTAQVEKKLPPLLFVPWIDQTLLNPQTLLQHGKEWLKRIHQSDLGICPPIPPRKSTYKNNLQLSLRMSNIRSLTKEKINIDRATESILGISPDAYIYVESRFDPSQSSLSKYRQVFHSSREEGQGGTTVLLRKSIGVSFSETQIPDTVVLVLHKGRATIILAGIYLSHRLGNKSQRIALVLETVSQLASRFTAPNILIFGDLNMGERTAHNNFEKHSQLLAHLGLKVVEDYESPPSFPSLATRKGTNRHGDTVHSRLDYILTNSTFSVSTEFVESFSDHILLNFEIELQNSGVRRALRLDRNRIIREITTLKDEDITSVMTFVRQNMHSYKKFEIQKTPTPSNLSFICYI